VTESWRDGGKTLEAQAEYDAALHLCVDFVTAREGADKANGRVIGLIAFGAVVVLVFGAALFLIVNALR
jgi:hypothetical protein